MKLLLDTHILRWVMRDAIELSAAARTMIARAEEVYVSSISLWEAAIKSSLGKLPVAPVRLEAAALHAGFRPLAPGKAGTACRWLGVGPAVNLIFKLFY